MKANKCLSIPPCCTRKRLSVNKTHKCPFRPRRAPGERPGRLRPPRPLSAYTLLGTFILINKSKWMPQQTALLYKETLNQRNTQIFFSVHCAPGALGARRTPVHKLETRNMRQAMNSAFTIREFSATKLHNNDTSVVHRTKLKLDKEVGVGDLSDFVPSHSQVQTLMLEP